MSGEPTPVPFSAVDVDQVFSERPATDGVHFRRVDEESVVMLAPSDGGWQPIGNAFPPGERFGGKQVFVVAQAATCS